LEQSILRVLIVEDYEPMRRFVATKLQTKQELRIISEAADGLEAVEKAQELRPDLILMDIGLPTLNGIDAARKIQKLSPESKILFVSENRSSDVAEEALRSGGLGYVVKSDAEMDLLPAVDAVLHGKRFVSASLAGHFLVTTSLTAIQTMHVSWILTLISGMG
jgi:DNA-binding NarL/FixJ family response regulator